MADVEMNVSNAEIHIHEAFTNVPEAEWNKIAFYNV